MYSIKNIDNYNYSTVLNKEYILKRYIEIMGNYLQLIKDNIYFKQHDYSKYLIINGIQTVNHIFNMLFLYTNNIELTLNHLDRSFIYYVEFINQIMNNNSMINLNSRDASIFLYKKTIYDIDDAYKKEYNINDNQRKEFNSIIDVIILYNELFYLHINDANNIIEIYKSFNKKFLKINTGNLINNISKFISISLALKEKIDNDKLLKILFLVGEQENIILKKDYINITAVNSEDLMKYSCHKLIKFIIQH